MNNFTIVRGFRADFPVQCWCRGGITAAVFNSNDTLAGAFYPFGAASSACTPVVTFYTAAGTQTGYGQGQVSAAFTAAQSAALEPGTTYVLVVSRALAAAPTVFDAIAIARFDVVAPSHPMI